MFWRVLGHLVVGGLCLVFVVFSFAGLIIAYQDLSGPYCDRHLMDPADTCSVVTADLYRGVQTIEKLNPRGTQPAVLTPPPNWHATPEKTFHGVYSPAGMRDFHRTTGYEMLGFSALLALIPASWGYRAYRVARTKRQSIAAAVADESHGRS